MIPNVDVVGTLTVSNAAEGPNLMASANTLHHQLAPRARYIKR
jgi:hypothetical protein